MKMPISRIDRRAHVFLATRNFLIVFIIVSFLLLLQLTTAFPFQSAISSSSSSSSSHSSPPTSPSESASSSPSSSSPTTPSTSTSTFTSTSPSTASSATNPNSKLSVNAVTNPPRPTTPSVFNAVVVIEINTNAVTKQAQRDVRATIEETGGKLEQAETTRLDNQEDDHHHQRGSSGFGGMQRFIEEVVANGGGYSSSPMRSFGWWHDVNHALYSTKNSAVTGQQRHAESTYQEAATKQKRDDGSKIYLAAQYYYDSAYQKTRIDATIPGGFVSTFAFYAYGFEWIYTYNNNHSPTCYKYGLDKGSFPGTNWLDNVTFAGSDAVMGVQVNHWQGSGNHLGPNLGSTNFDYFVDASDNSTPVLVSNSAFQQFFIHMNATDFGLPAFALPSICPPT